MRWSNVGGGVQGLLVLALLAGCNQQTPVPAQPAAAQAPAAAAEPAVQPMAEGPLQDVIEHAPAYMVGISYPPGWRRIPNCRR